MLEYCGKGTWHTGTDGSFRKERETMKKCNWNARNNKTWRRRQRASLTAYQTTGHGRGHGRGRLSREDRLLEIIRMKHKRKRKSGERRAEHPGAVGSSHVSAAPRGEEREAGREKTSGEKMLQKFSELLTRSKESQTQESQRAPSSMNTNTHLDTS